MNADATVRRCAVGVLLLVTALPVSGCRGAADCRGLDYDIAAGVTGAATPRAALDGFLAGPDSRGFPSGSWDGPSAGGVFTSGTASVTVTQVPGSTGWFVIDATTC